MTGNLQACIKLKKSIYIFTSREPFATRLLEIELQIELYKNAYLGALLYLKLFQRPLPNHAVLQYTD